MELTGTGGAQKKEDMIASIENGDGCVGVGWPGWISDANKDNTGFFPIPTRLSDSDPDHNSSIYGVWTLGIPSNSVNKDNAYQLLEYLMDPDVQRASVDHGGVPCRYSCLLDEDVLASHPDLQRICAALDSGIYRPIIKEWPEFYQYLGKEMMAIMNGEESVEDGLSVAQYYLEALLDK